MPVAYEDDGAEATAPRKLRVPKRRWMSVSDLVTEVEQALVKGERLDKASAAYANLQREATRLRMDNDALIAEADELKDVRDEYVAKEEQISARLSEAGGVSLHLAEMVDVTEKIKEVDIKLAGLRHQQQQNIVDVGLLKRTMSRIEKRGEVTSLVDRVKAALAKDINEEEGLTADGPEATALAELVRGLRDEYERAAPKVLAYERGIADLGSKLHRHETGLHDTERPTPEADEARMALISHLQQAKRMIAQLSRLRDIQSTNAQEIGMLERARAKLMRNVEIRRLLAIGDAQQLAAKVELLQEDTARIMAAIKEIEAGLEPHGQEAAAIISRLRSLKDVLTAETGKLREQLIANIHQKEQWKVRLAVLRGEKVQNLRFLAVLQAALASK